MRALVVLVLLTAAAAADEPAWDLAPSDFLRYERRKVTRKGDKESFGGGQIVTIQGHDLRGDGQYLPSFVRLGDFAAVFGFRLKAGRFALPVDDTVPLRCRVEVESGALDEASLALAVHWMFASRGKAERRTKFKMRKGTAHARLVFDRSKRIVRSARVTFAYTLVNLHPKPRERPKEIEEEWDIRLVEERRVGTDIRKEVNDAMAKGVKKLRTWQKEDGSFEPHGNYLTGTTALALLTLVACEVPRDDPAVKKALAYIVANPPRKTYARGTCLMAIERMYTPPGELHRAHVRDSERKRDLPPELRQWCLRVASELERECTTPGSWGYPSGSRALVRLDSSNTQYAVLGLRAAARLGYEPKENTWLGVVRHFRLHRDRTGPRGQVALIREGEAIVDPRDTTRGLVTVPNVAGFSYTTHSVIPTGSMTVAGISSLLVARNQLENMGKLTPRVDKEIGEMVLGGWAWLDRNWSMDRNPHKHGNNWYYYYLYALERAGVFDRVKRVGARDWYFEGACQLLARQGKAGQWHGVGKGSVSDTCFALLFLKRATAPLTQSR